ncbi:MAG: hypothetical protein QXN40_08500 [Candidatus Bathyarchaeia archaeon]
MGRAEEGGLTKDEINRLLRICVKDYPGFKPEPYLVAFKGGGCLEGLCKIP